MSQQPHLLYVCVRYVVAVLGVSLALNSFPLQPRATQPAVEHTTVVAVADFDEDGTPDLVVAGAPLIGLSGYGLVILGGNSVVRRLSTYDSRGIYIETGGNNIIEGNYIGTTPDGVSGTSLETSGVTLYSGNNRVGSTTAAARNILSSTYRGVVLATTAAANNLIQGNYIGLDVTGTKAIGRFDHIGIDPGNAVGTVISGTTAGAGNVISGGQKHGIHLAHVVRRHVVRRPRPMTPPSALSLLGDGLLAQGLKPD